MAQKSFKFDTTIVSSAPEPTEFVSKKILLKTDYWKLTTKMSYFWSFVLFLHKIHLFKINLLFILISLFEKMNSLFYIERFYIEFIFLKDEFTFLILNISF